jgi:integrase
MGSVRDRNGLLFFDFRFKGFRCREQTLLSDTPENRRKLGPFMALIDREIKEGTFDYQKYFPNSKNLAKVVSTDEDKVVDASVIQAVCGNSPLLKTFSEEWYEENLVRWKLSHQETIRGILDKHLLPRFGEMEVSHITKGDILKFRSSLAKVQIGNKAGLSPMRINHIMTSLRMILGDAADRYQFITPFRGIKPLKVPKSDVDPFTIDEVNLFLSNVREDFRDYYTIRFFTGMRTGEIDGLKWKHIDFNRRVLGRMETPPFYDKWWRNSFSSLALC